MNRLLQKAPTSLPIDDTEYPIHSDHITGLLTKSAIDDPALTQWEKQDIIFDNIYGCVPHDPVQAIQKALWFLGGGKEPDNKEHPQYIDFDIDADMLYAAMLKSGIDLDVVTLHWWTFHAKISELPESLETRVIYLRMQKDRGKLTKEEKAECGRIGWDIINMKKGASVTDEQIQAYINSE